MYYKEEDYTKTGGMADYLKHAEKAEEDYIGIESEEQTDEQPVDSDDFSFPYDIRKIRVEQKMITVFQVEHWISEGQLDLQPEYQRNLVWNNRRKTALIESLMMKIPIPAFYLDEDADGRKHVIDGMQRLSAIHEFMNDGFRLCKMQYLAVCEKRTFSQLDIKFRSYIEDTVLTVNILDERCPQMVKFDVFRRVNTGGMPLNPQEIRNIMAEPKVRKLLKSMSESKEFQRATGGKVNDIRMGAQELCLRYLTILEAYDWNKNIIINYRGLLQMMDAMVLTMNHMTQVELDHILDVFKQIMIQCQLILGEYSFRKSEGKPINKSVFTAWAVVLANVRPEKEVFDQCREEIREKYFALMKNDSRFYDAITSSTGMKSNIEISIYGIRRIVEECYDR